MKDSQLSLSLEHEGIKYIKVNNERFSTGHCRGWYGYKYIKVNNERFSTHETAERAHY